MAGTPDGQHAARAAASLATRTWLHGETLESLTELNEQVLELLADQARQREAAQPPLLLELNALWAALDLPARQRAATCPYLIVDAGFAEPRNWAWVGRHAIHDAAMPARAAFFTGARAIRLLGLVLTYGWHLARSRPSAARLLLGMPPGCADRIAACTLKQISGLADQHPEWLQPRWPARLPVWRELLQAAIGTDRDGTLEQARVRGLQMLAAEARAAQAAG